MVCPRCRTPNPEGTNICIRCATPIDLAESTLEVSPGAPATAAIETGEGTAWSSPATVVDGATVRSIQTGDVLAERYEILKLLGEGGMGAVYRARDRELDRLVAVKVIRPELASNAQVLQRFKQELILARQVTHRNISRIFDLGQAQGTRFITMEYIEGEDVAQILSQRGKLPASEAVAIMTQVLRGLDAAHGEGVVHRDLKPQNIMIDQQGKAFVMDFGIARSVDASNMTRTGALLGTPAYMSPEQAQGQKVDARSDLYTSGIIFYELLTGTPPFEADNPMATLVRRIQEKPAPPMGVEPTIPKALNDIILKMLATAPADRYQTAAEILAELDRWEAERTGRTTQTVAPAPLKPGADLTIKIVAAALAVMLAVVGWLFVHQRSQTGQAPAAAKTVTVLVADFQNSTGDSVFDGTLEPTFGLALEGASFISAYSRAQAHDAARKLQPDATKLDENLARAVARGQGISAVVSGRIEARDGGYTISVKALDTVTGNTMAEKSATASGKQDVLAAAGKLAGPIRKALGDSAPESAQMLAAETYSTTSLDAAQAYSKGQEVQWKGQSDQAIQFYEKAVSLDPNMGRAYAGLAVAHANLGQREEADKYFQLAMAKTDRMTEREKYRTRGAYYLAVRNDQKAVEECSNLIKQYPADDAGRTNLALAYFYSRNIPRAIEEGRKAIEINPQNALYRNNVALYAMYGGQFEDAIREAGEVLKLDAAYRKAYVAIALSHFALGRTADAEAAYRKLEAVDARGASLAAIGLADLALYEGRRADAIAILEKGVAADLANKFGSAAAIKLSAMAAARRSAEAAGRALAQAAGKQPGAEFAAARTLLEAGQEAKAVAVASQMGALLAPEPQAYAKLLEGEAQLRKGNAREAIRIFEDAKKLADTWLGHLDLGRAYLEAGAFTEASSELDVCLQRKGEATAVFLDEVPTYRYLPAVYYYRARVQEGLKSAGAAESYKTFLAIVAKADEGDPMVADARKRAAALAAQ